MSVNPLKSSQPLGAAFAYLGVAGAMPLFHGSQGCTSFALVLFVRHFKETIPLQTTAMDEVATILGGADHLEEAILNLKNRTKPSLIGICTTALVETRGEDFAGDVAGIKARRAEELGGTEVVLSTTPDFEGAIEEGWAKAVTSMIEGVTIPGIRKRDPDKVAILAGWHLTVADIEHIRDVVESFGLSRSSSRMSQARSTARCRTNGYPPPMVGPPSRISANSAPVRMSLRSASICAGLQKPCTRNAACPSPSSTR